MKKLVLFFVLLSSVCLWAATPTLDGSFDGEGVWGAPVATADGIAGWANANVTAVYTTYDATYVYFGASVTSSDWQMWAFTVNTVDGSGGTTDPWARAIDYAYLQAPDYVLVGHFGDYGEIRSWNGSGFDSSALGAGDFAETITGADQATFLEVRVTHTQIANAMLGDIQMYISGDNNNHGVFDACPNTTNSYDWDMSGDRSQLTTYTTDVTLPVTLASFFTTTTADGYVNINWKSASETGLLGYKILRSRPNELNSAIYVNASIITAQNSSTGASYSHLDVEVEPGATYTYWLQSVDLDGTITLCGNKTVTVQSPDGGSGTPAVVIPVNGITGNYPNPFNPNTRIDYYLEQTSPVTVSIHSLDGRLVSKQTVSHNTPGKGSIFWDGRDLNKRPCTSGIYLYKLQQGKDTYTAKMIMLK